MAVSAITQEPGIKSEVMVTREEKQVECGGHLVVEASRQNDVFRCGVPLQVADPA